MRLVVPRLVVFLLVVFLLVVFWLVVFWLVVFCLIASCLIVFWLIMAICLDLAIETYGSSGRLNKIFGSVRQRLLGHIGCWTRNYFLRRSWG
jgi:hypothetical protein